MFGRSPVASRRLSQTASFSSLRAVNRVADGLVAAAAIARQRRARREMLAPIDALHGLKDALRAAGVDRTHAQQHTGRGARPQAGAIAHLERALEFHIMAAFAHLARAVLRQLLRQHRGCADRRRRDPIAHVVVHARTILPQGACLSNPREPRGLLRQAPWVARAIIMFIMPIQLDSRPATQIVPIEL